MTSPALLAVAHGSPDPRSEPVLDALIARVRSQRPDLVVILAYLGHNAPDVPTALRGLAAQGVTDVVAVPLLLTSAFHAKADLPALLAQGRLDHPNLTVTQADVLGPHPLLFELLRRRLTEAGADADTAVVLGAVGTSDAAANAELADVAATLGATVGFASGEPDIDRVVASVRASGARHIAVAAYVLAPGTLPDRFFATQADVVTRPFGAEPEIVEIVLSRYDSAAGATREDFVDNLGGARIES